MLNTLGFIWSMEEKSWNDNFEKLRSFVQEHGSLDFQQSRDPSIQRWFYSQRVKFANNNLSEERIKRLESIGLRFDGERSSSGDGDGGMDHSTHNSRNKEPSMCNVEFPLRPPDGVKIRKKRFMEGWANGEVIAQEKSGARVQYEDGDEEYLSEEEYRLSAIAYQLHVDPPKPPAPMKILMPIKRGRGRPKGSRNKARLVRPPIKKDDKKDGTVSPPKKKIKRPDPPNLPKTPYQNIIGAAPGEAADENDVYETI